MDPLLQRQIFIFGTLGYLKLGSFWKAVEAIVTFSDSDSCSKIFEPGSIWARVRNIFKFEIPTAVQTLATIHAIEIQQCFHLGNDIYEKTRQTHAGAENEKLL